jgi:hypothetical protein
MTHINTRDHYLHNPDGTHRSTPPNTNGHALNVWGRAHRRHIAAHEARGDWLCGGCNCWTSTNHWRQGADGVMFHAGPDAPPSDETSLPQNFAS